MDGVSRERRRRAAPDDPVARWTESGGGLLRDLGGGIRPDEGGRDHGCVRHAASGDRSARIVVCAGLGRVAGRFVFLLPGLCEELPPRAPWADTALLQRPTSEARAAPTSGGRCDVLRGYRGCATTRARALRRGNDRCWELKKNTSSELGTTASRSTAALTLRCGRPSAPPASSTSRVLLRRPCTPISRRVTEPVGGFGAGECVPCPGRCPPGRCARRRQTGDERSRGGRACGEEGPRDGVPVAATQGRWRRGARSVPSDRLR